MGSRVGILAIQGDFEAHAKAISAIGALPVVVKRAAQLDGIDALILPGGESTTIAKGLDRLALYEPIAAFARDRKPILGTCAGAVLLAREVENHPVRPLGLVDLVAVRNAYGTQVDSFATLAETGLTKLRCVFIRAPQLRRLGPDVEILARVENHPVWVRQGSLMATTFHPELTPDPRIHQALLDPAGTIG